MENNIINQILMATLMYFGVFFSYYLPIKLFKKNNQKDLDLTNGHLKHSNLNSKEFMNEQKQKRIYSNCNCLATGIFIAMCFLSLMPMVKQEFNDLFLYAKLTNFKYPIAELTVLLGFFMVLYLEQLIMKFKTKKNPLLLLDEELVEEHGYKLLDNVDNQSISTDTILNNQLNTIENKNNSKSRENLTYSSQHNNHHHEDEHYHLHFDMNQLNNSSNLSFFMLIFASGTHSIFEGLALGLIKDPTKALHLFIGILLHECIVAIALGINAAKVNQGAIFGLIFSATIPIGVIFGVLIGYTPGFFGKLVSAIFQGLAAGTFVHVAFYELLPTELNHHDHPSKQLKKTTLIFLGFLIMALLALISD